MKKIRTLLLLVLVIAAVVTLCTMSIRHYWANRYKTTMLDTLFVAVYDQNDKPITIRMNLTTPWLDDTVIPYDNAIETVKAEWSGRATWPVKFHFSDSGFGDYETILVYEMVDGVWLLGGTFDSANLFMNSFDYDPVSNDLTTYALVGEGTAQ